LRAHGNGSAFNAAVTPDGLQVVSAGIDGDIWLWDLKSGAQVNRFSAAAGAGDSAWVVGLAVMPDSRRVVTGGNDKTVCIWDLKTGERLKAQFVRGTQ
jgi:WD40 repeat protein